MARERLFSVLDEAREHKPAICVVGPPGAGKTTLVASWLDAHGIKGIWYQVDAGDADLATFFYYLGEAARPFTRKGQRPLPALTPEYLHDVEGFSRRFFRELFSRFPEGSLLVLDNYQEVVPEQKFHQLIAQAVEDVPAGVTLIAISRRDPPDCYARLIANENVQRVDWDDLQLTFEETRLIVKAKGAVERPEEIERLHQQSGGWAAGLTLILEGYRKNDKPLSEVPAGRDAIFEYFAAQIFERVSEDVRQFLMATSFLPTVQISVAEALTGEPASAKILEDLYRRHIFTHRRPGQEPTYWYHSLFQAFLRAQADRLIAGDERRALKRRAARLLDAQGVHDQAFALFRESEDWEGAMRLILHGARDLIAHGRGGLLREWIGALPTSILAPNPWLQYWFGTSLIPVDQTEARVHLQRAFEQFTGLGNLAWQCVTAASLIDAYYFEWSDFRPMKLWAAQLGKLIGAIPVYESREAELHVYSSWLLSMLYGEPGHPDLSDCVERVTQMLDEEFDVNNKVRAATFLLAYCNIACDLDRARRVVQRIRPLAEHPDLSSLTQIWWTTRVGYFQYLTADYGAAGLAFERARRVVTEQGLQGSRASSLLLASYEQSVAGATRNFRKMSELADEIIANVTRARPLDIWHAGHARVHYGIATGDAALVVKVGPATLDAAQQSGMVYALIQTLVWHGVGLAEVASHEEVVKTMESARAALRQTCFEFWEPQTWFAEAYSLLRHGYREDAMNTLERALSLERKFGRFYANICRMSFIVPKLFAEALAAGIDCDHVRELIRKYGIRPPPNCVEAWPWSIRVFALGRFEILIDDELLTFAGKAPKKPLALLKALIAFGGRNVPEERLMDALWPDEEADAARKSLDITVLRLRKLLGSHDTIMVSDELIGLNPQLCWTDVWAFERRIAQTEAAEGEPELSAAAAVTLYRGNFLPADAEEPWTVKARERLRAKFVRLVESVAQADEAAGHWEKAMVHYLKGLEADDLVEAFHLGLMRCYRALGRPAEAIAAFRRLRQTLSVVLGIAPSPAAEAFARELQKDSAARHS